MISSKLFGAAAVTAAAACVMSAAAATGSIVLDLCAMAIQWLE
jgi:hypothetical protein